VLQELSRALMMAEDFARSIQFGSQSLELAEELGLESTRSRNLNTLGVARIVMGDVGGLHDLEQAIAIAAAAHSHEECAALANLTWITAFLGDLRRAGELHEQCRQLADRLGLEAYISWQRGENVFHSYWEGRWDDALETATSFIRDVERGSGHYMETSCRYIRGAIELARGDIQAALGDARRATERARATKDPQSLQPALGFEVRALVAAGENAAAGALADEVVAYWKESGVGIPHESVDSAWSFRDLERTDQLLAALERATAPTPWHEAARRIASGDLVGAANLYDEIGSVPDEAYARLRAAEELVRAGRRAVADAQLRLALPVFTRLGASAWQAEGEALLAASA
jgi:tetratricopeptide (TPR) repeat protein